MAKSIDVKGRKLTALKIKSLKEGNHRDPECMGLYIAVRPRQQGDEYNAEFGFIRSWLFRFTSPETGKERWMGLGHYPTIELAEARDLAKAARRLVILGRDPIEHRIASQKAERQARLLERNSTVTFAYCVDQYLAENLGAFKNAKHRSQWKETLARASKDFGAMNVASVDGPTIIKFLTPIWHATPETATRLRGRIEQVLNWATVHEFRSGDNPARWKGYLEHKFSAPAHGHHKAMPFADLPAFMAKLRENDSISARALEMTILTALRTGEAVGAKWSEVDFDKAAWTVPASRMKKKKEHVIPLSDRALAILRSLQRPDNGVFVFPGDIPGKPLCDDAMSKLLKGIDSDGNTVHGFRSTFRDWAGEETDFDHETIEFALAHEIPNKTQAAYRRYRSLNKRALLMRTWADYCAGSALADNVVTMHRA